MEFILILNLICLETGNLLLYRRAFSTRAFFSPYILRSRIFSQPLGGAAIWAVATITLAT